MMIKNIYALILWITAQHGEYNQKKKKAHLINTLNKMAKVVMIHIDLLTPWGFSVTRFDYTGA